MWDTTVKTKTDLSSQLMFEEIMKLRKQAAALCSSLELLVEAIETSDNTIPRIQRECEMAKVALQLTINDQK